MNPPAAVRFREQRPPFDRPQNVPFEVTPPALKDFAYYHLAFTAGSRARYLSVWAFPWWFADPMTGYGSGAYGAGAYGGEQE